MATKKKAGKWPRRPAAELDSESSAAFEALSKLRKDPLAKVVKEHGKVSPYDRHLATVFEDPLSALTYHIVSQQISRAAAMAIYGRLETLLGGSIDPALLAEQDEEQLRSVGLSKAKAKAIHELGQRVVAGELDFEALRKMDDEEAFAALVELRGIGPWSAEVFLMRDFQRPDFFPAADIGLRQSMKLLDGLDKAPSAKEAAARAEAWRPYRSYASTYLWHTHPSNQDGDSK
jgi:DNA-3-methyladenine glycosylase II